MITFRSVSKFWFFFLAFNKPLNPNGAGQSLSRGNFILNVLGLKTRVKIYNKLVVSTFFVIMVQVLAWLVYITINKNGKLHKNIIPIGIKSYWIKPYKPVHSTKNYRLWFDFDLSKLIFTYIATLHNAFIVYIVVYVYYSFVLHFRNSENI